MSESDRSTNDRTSGHSDDRASSADSTAEWFAASTLRMALALIGLVLLLFALGQAVGFDLLGLVADALQSEAGRWIAVAIFGLILIMVALRGFDVHSE